MTRHLNSAAIKRWNQIKQDIEEPLKMAFQKSGLRDSDRKLIITEMLSNSLDTAPEKAQAAVEVVHASVPTWERSRSTSLIVAFGRYLVSRRYLVSPCFVQRQLTS